MTDTHETDSKAKADTTSDPSPDGPVTPRYSQRWKQYRNASLQKYAFPFKPYRKGQRDMMACVYTAIRDRRHGLIQAPTGIGKTLGTLYPALKAMGKGHCDKIFYLAARTTGKMVARQACDSMRATGAALSYVEIVSKEKVCFNTLNPKQCDECAYGLGYENRIDDALETGCAREALHRADVEEVARAHRVCPFELSLDLSLKMDVIICDYNYAFDPRVYLKRYFDKEDTGRFVFLVDEGHNLVDRGRSMFSAQIASGHLKSTRLMFADKHPKEAGAIARVEKQLSTLAAKSSTLAEAKKPAHLIYNDTRRALGNRNEADTAVLYAVPESLTKSIKSCLTTLGKWLENTDNVKFRTEISDVYYQLTIFFETADTFDAHYRLFVESRDDDIRLNIYCIDPSTHLADRFKKCVCAVVFSATLFPMDYYRQVLGLNDNCLQLQLPSPFPPENLRVMHHPVNTTYRHREANIKVVVEKIHQMLQHQPGNYLVFFPAYTYMEQVFEQFIRKYSHHRAFKQESSMSESERLHFIDKFQTPQAPGAQGSGDEQFQTSPHTYFQSSRQTSLFQSATETPRENPTLNASNDALRDTKNNASTVGFAVLGGVFGEGIDLVGDRLVGVAIVGVGMPGLCVERDEIKDYFGGGTRGFHFAYTYPGMTRVLQAAGRVIRTSDDKGIVLLIDHRFARNDYRCLLPSSWHVVPDI
ncbi:MAG: ATP-dependent DNA helicase [Deltaproteobacteria bacterium]|nr:ATP-dependent DNA helicase [Deltaproteobacteria bacterium]